MATLLVDELTSLTDRVRSGTYQQNRDLAAMAEDATELTAMALHLFHRIEVAATKAQSPDRSKWDEGIARQFIPIFKQWYDFASVVKPLNKACKLNGVVIEGSRDLLDACNLSKIMWVGFDTMVDSMRRMERGEPLVGRPLEEVMDELRRKDGDLGGK